MPASSGTNTRDFVSFFVFWLGSLPFLWFPVHKIRHLFTVKAFFVPVAGISFFVWAIVRAHGIGPIVRQGSTIHGSVLGWAMVKGIMSAIANFATLIVNDPDFARTYFQLRGHDRSATATTNRLVCIKRRFKKYGPISDVHCSSDI